MNEYKFIMLLIVALVFFGLHRLTSRPNNNQIQTYDGTGKIERILNDDSGYPWYYVSISINGKMCTAKTGSYKSTPDSVDIGDVVSVKYHYTKNGNIRCVITENGYVPFGQNVKAGKPVLLYVSAAFLVLFLLSLIRKVWFD